MKNYMKKKCIFKEKFNLRGRKDFRREQYKNEKSIICNNKSSKSKKI